MRIAVSGKGGAGKTTTSATLARIYARRGFRVNALDDDPNPNLATALGMSPDEVALLRRVPREDIVEERMDIDGHMHVLLTKPFDEVIDQYAIRAPDDVNVLTMTGLLGAGQGWLCAQHRAVRGVMSDLATSRPDDVTILDMEASIEHLTRGTVREVDALLVVTEPYYRSLETAARLVPLAHELGVERVWLVANKVRTEGDETAIVEFCERKGYELIGSTPFDEGVSEADRLGKGLIDVSPSGPAVMAITALADTLTEKLGSTSPTAG